MTDTKPPQSDSFTAAQLQSHAMDGFLDKHPPEFAARCLLDALEFLRLPRVVGEFNVITYAHALRLCAICTREIAKLSDPPESARLSAYVGPLLKETLAYIQSERTNDVPYYGDDYWDWAYVLEALIVAVVDSNDIDTMRREKVADEVERFLEEVHSALPSKLHLNKTNEWYGPAIPTAAHRLLAKAKGSRLISSQLLEQCLKGLEQLALRPIIDRKFEGHLSRPDYSYWHLGQVAAEFPGQTPPVLQMTNDDLKRVAEIGNNQERAWAAARVVQGLKALGQVAQAEACVDVLYACETPRPLGLGIVSNNVKASLNTLEALWPSLDEKGVGKVRVMVARLLDRRAPRVAPSASELGAPGAATTNKLDVSDKSAASAAQKPQQASAPPQVTPPPTGAAVTPPAAPANPSSSTKGTTIGIATVLVVALLAWLLIGPKSETCTPPRVVVDQACLPESDAAFIECVRKTGLAQVTQDVKSAVKGGAEGATLDASKAEQIVSTYAAREPSEKKLILEGCLELLHARLGKTGSSTSADAAAPSARPTESETPILPDAGAGARVDLLFEQHNTNEVALAQDGEALFRQSDFRSAIKFLEQAKVVESSGVWRSSMPFLAGAYYLTGAKVKAKATLEDMTGALGRGYLSHASPIGFLLSNLGEVRNRLPRDGQALFDKYKEIVIKYKKANAP